MSQKPSETSESLEGIVRDVLSGMARIVPCPLVVSDVRGRVLGTTSSAVNASCPLCLKVIDVALREKTAPIGGEECECDDASGAALPLRNAYLEVIGAVAALGTADQVRPYALAVKHQIELVIKTQYKLRSGFLKENAIQDIIQDFVNYIPGVSDLELLEARARYLGFSPGLLYVPIVFDMHNFRQFIRDSWKDASSSEDCREAENFIQSVKNRVLLRTKEVFSAPDDVSVPLNGDKYAVFCSISPKIQQDKDLVFKRVNENSHILLRKFEEEHLSAVLGIGFFFKGVPGLSYAYRSALEAVSLGKLLFKQPGIYDIQNLRVESLLLSLPASARQRFIRDRFTEFNLDPNDDELKNTIIVYGMNFFNRQSTADELHIHRNTLNYRLKKIEERTQKSLRSFRNYIELYIACLLSNLPSPDLELQKPKS